MSAYDRDPRVTVTTSGYRVDGGRGVSWVDRSPERGWCVFRDNHLGLLRADFNTADEAIRDLIGEPQ